MTIDSRGENRVLYIGKDAIDMDMQQLQYFVSSAQLLNFTAAANRHYTTQPTICRQISDLETQLGAKLFLRSTHGIALTEAGREFLSYAMDVLALMEQAKTRIQNIENGKFGLIRLSALPSSTAVLTDCMALFSGRHPEIQVDIDLTSGIGQIEAINQGSSDFYFAFTSMVDRKSGLSHVRTFIDRYCLVVHKRYAGEVNPADFSTLAKRPFVMISRAMGPIIFDQAMEICRARGCTPNIINHYTHAASSLISVNAGVGMTILPMTLVGESAADNIAVFPVEGPDAVLSYSVAWHNQSPNQAAERFKEVVLELYGGDKICG